MHMLEQHMGQDHVSAQDQADENMAQFGSGTYLTKYKDAYPTVEMTSANQLTIGTGSLLVNGRHCIIDTPEVLTVDNGSSGMTERDLVCVHWKEVEAEVQAASGDETQTITKEEVDLVIVKGTPASSGATDPEISQDTIRSGVGEAWVPFARITKDGLTPSVALIVDRLVPESDFRDSISRIDYGNVITGQVDAHTRISTTVEFEEPYSEAPVVFIQDVSPGGDVSNAINNKTIVFSVSTTGFVASSFNNTGSNFASMKFFWLAIGK